MRTIQARRTGRKKNRAETSLGVGRRWWNRKGVETEDSRAQDREEKVSSGGGKTQGGVGKAGNTGKDKIYIYTSVLFGNVSSPCYLALLFLRQSTATTPSLSPCR